MNGSSEKPMTERRKRKKEIDSDPKQRAAVLNVQSDPINAWGSLLMDWVYLGKSAESAFNCFNENGEEET